MDLKQWQHFIKQKTEKKNRKKIDSPWFLHGIESNTLTDTNPIHITYFFDFKLSDETRAYKVFELF